MANDPPATLVLDYNNAQPRVLLSTLLLDPTNDGSPLGTGGPALASAEPSTVLTANDNIYPHNREVEFASDRFALIAGTPNNGVYRKDEGGAGQWGRVTDIPGGGGGLLQDGLVTGLFVMHPSSTPTLCFMYYDTAGDLYLASSLTGLSGSWTHDLLLAGTGPSNGCGVAMPFRDALFWALDSFATGGHLRSYDIELGTLTNYGTTVFGSHKAATLDLHVHKNRVFAIGYKPLAPFSPVLARIDGGVLTQIYDFTVDGQDGGGSTGRYGHHCMFTDPTTGDLICFLSGRDDTSFQGDTKVLRVVDADSAPIVSDISGAVLGAVEGADKYQTGGGGSDQNRSWYVYVDNDTDPLNPRIFLTTFVTGTTETWEWIDISSEIEVVASGAGIGASQFAMGSVKFGGAVRTPVAARVEIGDASNPDVEAPGGRRFFFRAYGNGGPFTASFFVAGTEDVPDTLVPIVNGTLNVVSGAPATTPAIAGSTIINITPDPTVLYSVTFNLSAVSIGGGQPGRLMADLV